MIYSAVIEGQVLRCARHEKPRIVTPFGRISPLANAHIVSIVDDDESVRGATAKLVRLHGFAAYGFATAEEFLQSPRLNDTSCLITDLQMPGMNGIELQRHLIAQGLRVPVIFITAFPEERARALEAGAAGFLTKPFLGENLIDCLNGALKRPTAYRAPSERG